MVQACQQTEENRTRSKDGFDLAQRACPSVNTHIILTIPHTVLLLASMRDGFAKRGAYTDAMAHEFRTAEGNSDIYELHGRAVAEMIKKYGDEQTPELRSTLKKKLVLRSHHVGSPLVKPEEITYFKKMVYNVK